MNIDDFGGSACLIYGIGNVGRQDDGLGWAFVDRLEAETHCPAAEIRRHYQLNLEDAELISHKKRVLFVDATKDTSVRTFTIKPAEPKMDFSFTSHTISISSIVATCQKCFDCSPEVYVLAIRGYEWELEIGLTQKAERNLNLAIADLAGPEPSR